MASTIPLLALMQGDMDSGVITTATSSSVARPPQSSQRAFIETPQGSGRILAEIAHSNVKLRHV